MFTKNKRYCLMLIGGDKILATYIGRWLVDSIEFYEFIDLETYSTSPGKPMPGGNKTTINVRYIQMFTEMPEQVT